MKRIDKSKQRRQQLVTGAKIAAGIVGFAVLMAVRTEVALGWLRVLMAALAFGILAFVLLQARHHRS